MRSRTFPQAGVRNAFAYYDWGQRPCPSPPLPEPVALSPVVVLMLNRLRPDLVSLDNCGSKTKFFCIEYSTPGMVLGREIVYLVHNWPALPQINMHVR